MLCFALAAYIGLYWFDSIYLKDFSFSFVKGITRITDNRHHATDVLSGAILGTAIAIIAVREFRIFKIY